MAMKYIKKGKEPSSLLAHRKKSYADYDNYAEKDELRDALLNEQGDICCYCMQRISKDNMKIEHWKPQSQYPELQLDYENLRASCKGNDGKSKFLPRHCDTSKAEQEITLNPVDEAKNCEKLIEYRRNGKIYSHDPIIDKELNDILNLNTQTLVNNRSEIIDQIIEDLTRIKGKKAEWSISEVKKKIQQYESKANGKYKPYCQVVIYFLKKRFAKELK
ncbi:conserved hypothetical protein [Beggiatoa sp. PS]|nr:conserved hypothetical protein [Beggiatoa sp. PS]